MQEHVEHIGVSLLDLVEEDYRIGLSANLLGELAALVKADISGRRTDELGDRMLLHVLGHIEAEHGVFVAEHSLSKSLAQLGFADACGAEEDERADGTLGILKTYPAAADSLGDRCDSLVLTDYALVENLLHVEQPLALLLGELNYRHARPVRDDPRDNLGVDLSAAVLLSVLPVLAGVVEALLNLLLLVAELCRALEILLVDRARLLLLVLLEGLLKLLDVVGRCHGLEANL